MIPLIFHYCWFGKPEKPISVKRNLDTWLKLNPDYELMEWNESNFNLTNNMLFVKQAYHAKKYAFVSDVARIYALIKYGGIYMDTDVEMIKSIPKDLLQSNSVIGFERSKSYKIGTAFIASECNNSFWISFYETYKTKSFILNDGSYNTITNVDLLTNTLLKKGLILNNKYQEICKIRIFPTEYFSPKSYITNKISLTDNSICIHNFSSTWMTSTQKIKLKSWNQINTHMSWLANAIRFIYKIRKT